MRARSPTRYSVTAPLCSLTLREGQAGIAPNGTRGPPPAGGGPLCRGIPGSAVRAVGDPRVLEVGVVVLQVACHPHAQLGGRLDDGAGRALALDRLGEDLAVTEELVGVRI